MRSKYAVCALIELARLESAGGTKPVRLAEIAERRDIPVQFLEQVFAALRRALVVNSRRGASGGYTLARPPDQITVLEVVAALDGIPSREECARGQCEHASTCSAAPVWMEAQRATEDVLRETTIGDLLRREDAARCAAPMYHI